MALDQISPYFSQKAIFASLGRNWTSHFLPKIARLSPLTVLALLTESGVFVLLPKNARFAPKNARFSSDRPEHRKIVATSRLAISGAFWRFCSIAKNRQILPKNARFPSDRPERRDGRFITDGHVAVVKRAGPLSLLRAVPVLCYNIINIIISDRNRARSEI